MVVISIIIHRDIHEFAHRRLWYITLPFYQLYNHCLHFKNNFQSIKELESSMKNSLEEITAQLPDVYEKSQFNLQDLFAILQGLTGFLSGISAKDPCEFISAAIEVAGHFATKCNTGSLQDLLKKTKKWLKFGKEYAALKDSSDLDFDKMDVASVPEVMKVITHTR